MTAAGEPKSIRHRAENEKSGRIWILIVPADISDADVKSAGLAVRPAPLADMPHHAELTGWPQGDDEDAKLQRIDIATDLADVSVYVAKE